MAIETIRYEVQCRFCARYLSGDSASDALFNIAEHDVTHAACGRCRVTRVTVPGATLCDDCHNDPTLDAPVLTDEDAPEAHGD